MSSPAKVDTLKVVLSVGMESKLAKKLPTLVCYNEKHISSDISFEMLLFLV